MKTYIVLHSEIMGGDNPHVDTVVAHVASSFKKAHNYIKKTYALNAYSWWEISSLPIDERADTTFEGLYGRRGGKVKDPYKKALDAYEKCRKNPKHHLYTMENG